MNKGKISEQKKLKGVCQKSGFTCFCHCELDPQTHTVLNYKNQHEMTGQARQDKADTSRLLTHTFLFPSELYVRSLTAPSKETIKYPFSSSPIESFPISSVSVNVSSSFPNNSLMLLDDFDKMMGIDLSGI